MIQVFFCPESPRWYISKGRYPEAYKSLERLRHKPIQAARDLYCTCSNNASLTSLTRVFSLTDIHVLLEAEKSIQRDRSGFIELFTVPRNARATLASLIVMFMQQLYVVLTIHSTPI